jgi:hypothetical protein
MLNVWLHLKQFAEALHLGRLDEACQWAKQPLVRAHQRAGELLQELTIALLARARKHLLLKDRLAAWHDVQMAEEVGGIYQQTVDLKKEVIESGIRDIRAALDAGQPQRALELISQVRKCDPQATQLNGLESVAQAWIVAEELAAKGELTQALTKLETVPWRPFRALAEWQTKLTEQNLVYREQLARLQSAMEARHWREVISVADALLVIAPQHQDVRRARTRAWKELEPPTQSYATPPKEQTPVPQVQPVAGELPRRLLLWIDGVGGFLVCLCPRVSLGQATAEAYVDVPIYADISRLQAYITRDAEGHVLEAIRPTSVNEKAVEKALLRDGDRLRFNSQCQLNFKQPVAISSTALLHVTSRHRLPWAVDGILLLGETCLLSGSGDAHIHVPGLKKRVAIVRRKEGLAVQTAGEFEVDGQHCKDRAEVNFSSTVNTEELRFTFEPIAFPAFKGTAARSEEPKGTGRERGEA